MTRITTLSSRTPPKAAIRDPWNTSVPEDSVTVVFHGSRLSLRSAGMTGLVICRSRRIA
jgi:hypothetical protein